jgi:2-polyprenyl-3-methyl-5-hydroxy-6-metoxy-1,4-benzoquinol methylase
MLRKDSLKPFKLDASTASEVEVARFSALAEEWWKPDGAFAVVHSLNETRVRLLMDVLLTHFKCDSPVFYPLSGKACARCRLRRRASCRKAGAPWGRVADDANRRRFATEGACAEYLFERRWPEGFVCPGCGEGRAWLRQTKAFTYECVGC